MILRASWVSLYVTKAGVRLQRASQLQVGYIKVSWESMSTVSGSVGVERVVHEQVTRLFSGEKLQGASSTLHSEHYRTKWKEAKPDLTHRP